MKESDRERFLATVDKRGPDECWPWTGTINAYGYGRFAFENRTVTAHRAAFFVEHGRWPEPQCCHDCDSRPCCNPAHLWEGTNAENTADKVAKGRQARQLGERHSGAKLTETEAASLLSLRGTMTQAKAGALFGIGPQQVSRIWRGVRWSHLTTDKRNA